MTITDDRFKSLKKRAKTAGDEYDPCAKEFTVSEVKHIIAETVLTDEERKLCEMFFVRQMKAKTVSIEMDMSERTAYKRKKDLHKKLVATCKKLFLQ